MPHKSSNPIFRTSASTDQDDHADLEPIRERAGTGSFCGALGAKCACPSLLGRFSDGQLILARNCQATIVDSYEPLA